MQTTDTSQLHICTKHGLLADFHVHQGKERPLFLQATKAAWRGDRNQNRLFFTGGRVCGDQNVPKPNQSINTA